MTSGSDSTDPGSPDSPGVQKRRRVILPKQKGEMPRPPAPEPERPVWKKTWFWLFAVIALIIAYPSANLAWNILRPDTTASRKAAETRAAGTAPLRRVSAGLGLSRFDAGLIADAGRESGATPAVMRGEIFDPVLTPKFIAAYDAKKAVRNRVVAEGSEIPDVGVPPYSFADISAQDGLLRAVAAMARANNDAGQLILAAKTRLNLADDRVKFSESPASMAEALARLRSVFAEIRSDATLVATGGDAMKPLLASLVELSAPWNADDGDRTGTIFELELDAHPDAGLVEMNDKTKRENAGKFLRLALLARRPDEHRGQVSALLKNFGVALTKPTFREAIEALPRPGEPQSRRLATMLLRDEIFHRLGSEPVTGYFMPPLEPAGEGLETFLLQFTALSDCDDIYGEALLLHRRAALLALIADVDRTRFEAGATAYAIALEYRRAANDGQWPKDTEGLLAGLSETYPVDPFTDENPVYSKKKLSVHSAGADGVDQGGLAEPEFASELAQLWEPTVALEPEKPLDPKAFGLKPSDLDKPAAPHLWEPKDGEKSVK